MEQQIMSSSEEEYYDGMPPEVAAHFRRLWAGQPLPVYKEHNNLEKHLQENKLATWGFVIFRCTYDSDEDWNAMMDKMRSKEEKRLRKSGSTQLLETLKFTVVQDKSLNNTGVANVRARFMEWLETNPERHEHPVPTNGYTPRYQFCVMIDKAALQTILAEKEPHLARITRTPAYVIIIGVAHEVEEQQYWMKADFHSLMTRWYELLLDCGWHNEYKEPPRFAIG